MMAQARSNPLPDRLNEPLIGCIHAPLGHDVHGQFLG
jgi:hypothetical protein